MRPSHLCLMLPLAGRCMTSRAIVLSILCGMAAVAPVQAQVRSCEQLRNEIASRLNWPKDSYRLEIMAKDEVSKGETLGSCERGARKVVVYRDGAAPAPMPAAPPAAAPATAAAEPVVPKPAPSATSSAAPVAAPNIARRRGVDEAALDQYKEWITQARAKHPYADSEERMFQVMLCESGGSATIVNRAGPYSGLFQYATGTWKGAWNTYRDQDILDAKAQIFATALAWEKKMQRQWGCYTRAH